MSVANNWGLPLDLAAIPAALRRHNRWVVWTAVHKGEKVTKVPYQARGGRVGHKASVSNPAHWCSFEDAAAASSNQLTNGVGFVLTGIDTGEAPLVAVDIDHCIDSGVIAEWAQDIVDALPGYWELSPSGNGLRGLFSGVQIPRSFTNTEHGVEMYDGSAARYVTITGRRLDVSKQDVASCDQAALDRVYAQYRPAVDAILESREKAPMPPVLDDAHLIFERARQVLDQRFVDYLTKGTIASQYGGDNSSIIFALCIAALGAGLSEEEVFTLLASNPITSAVGERHWQNKGQDWLWRTVQSAKKKSCAGRVATDEDFEMVMEAAPVDQPLIEAAATKRAMLKGTIRPEDWQGAPPPREWLIEGWLGVGYVTLLYGSGGTGKSLLMQQLMTCLAHGVPFLGMPVRQARSVGLFCEDDSDELWRRQEKLSERYFFDAREVLEHATLVSRVGLTNTLASFGRDGGITLTKMHESMRAILAQEKPKLLVLDTVMDFFAGNENDRGQVTQFMNVLNGLAFEFNCAIILCAHPSRSGTESGTSGSTAWESRARMRWHFEREPTGDKAQPPSSVRVLTNKKANYTEMGGVLKVLWSNGVLVPSSDVSVQDFFRSEEERDDAVFRKLLLAALAMGVTLSKSSSARDDYAPRALLRKVAQGDGTKTTVRALEGAMLRSMKCGALRFGVGRQGNTIIGFVDQPTKV